MDEPMHILGTPVKASYNNYGPIDDVKALEVSSNVYMFNIAIRLAGGSICSLSVTWDFRSVFYFYFDASVLLYVSASAILQGLMCQMK